MRSLRDRQTALLLRKQALMRRRAADCELVALNAQLDDVLRERVRRFT
jgi:hypothetical protein